MREINFRENVFDELLAKFPSHEGIGCDYADKSRCEDLIFEWPLCQVEDPLNKGRREGVFHVARTESCSDSLVQRTVFHRDVGRISDYDLILLAQNLPNAICILNVVVMLKRVVC